MIRNPWPALGLVAALFVSAAAAQIQPRDANEAHALRLYNDYKESRRLEAQLDVQIKAKHTDALMAAGGTFGALGVDREALAQWQALTKRQFQVRDHAAKLLLAWEKKFYWRYGDLRWSDERIRDARTGREMDRIEFAMTYFPFNPATPQRPPPAPTAPPMASGGGASGTYPANDSFNGLQIQYEIAGIQVSESKDGDGFTHTRAMKGVLAGSELRVSGSAIGRDPPKCNTEYGSFYRKVDVVVVVDGRENRHQSPLPDSCDKSTQTYPFNLAVPIPPNARGGSFSITFTYVNPRFGNRGLVVSGQFGR